MSPVLGNGGRKVRSPRRRPDSFEGRTVLITGGASGIGQALGAQLHRHGARVVLADIDGHAADRAAGAMLQQRAGDAVVGLALDVTEADAFRSAVDGIIQRHGQLDMLFNNAGVAVGGPTHELTAAHWNRVIDVNLLGVVNGVMAAYPAMVAQGHGHIVNTASAAGLVAPPFVTPYATTKHAIVGLSTGLRPEAAIHGVRVSVLCPGSVETPILDARPLDLPAVQSHWVTPREYLAVAHQKAMPAERFARQALEHVARNRAIIVVPASAKPFWYLHRLSPRAAEQAARVIARRVQRDLIRLRS